MSGLLELSNKKLPNDVIRKYELLSLLTNYQQHLQIAKFSSFFKLYLIYLKVNLALTISKNADNQHFCEQSLNSYLCLCLKETA